jgi:hypothetical protein
MCNEQRKAILYNRLSEVEINFGKNMKINYCDKCRGSFKVDEMFYCKHCLGDYFWRCNDGHLDSCAKHMRLMRENQKNLHQN